MFLEGASISYGSACSYYLSSFTEKCQTLTVGQSAHTLII